MLSLFLCTKQIRRPTMKSQELFLKFKIRIFSITKVEFTEKLVLNKILRTLMNKKQRNKNERYIFV